MRYQRAWNWLWAMSLVSMSACVTSGQVAGDADDYIDPTNVQTVDAQTQGTTSAPAETPNLRIEELERDKAVLQGQLEESRVHVTALENENRRLMDELVKYKTQPQVPQAAIVTKEDLPEKTGAPLLWDLAKKDIREGNLKDALSPLEEIARTYPKDPRAYYALLGTGLLQYKLGSYKDAALAFNGAIDKGSKKPETSIAWLGQGAAFAKMGQKDDAKLFYAEVIKRFPKSHAAALAKKYTAKKKLGVPSDLFAEFTDWAANAPE